MKERSSTHKTGGETNPCLVSPDAQKSRQEKIMAVHFSIKHHATLNLVPDAILPVQFFAGATSRTGEQRLMLGILTDALDLLYKYRNASHPRERRLFAEAHEWVFSTDLTYLFSFENICAHVKLDPSYLRARIQRDQDQPAGAHKRIRIRHLAEMPPRATEFISA